MSYDMTQGDFVAAVLKDGTATHPVNGLTLNSQVAFASSGGVSYSTTSLINVANGSSATSSVVGDTSPYAASSLSANLAFAGQTAFNPPIYTSVGGDMIATSNGKTFTVSILASGKALISGATPYPIRGVKLTPTMLYLTMAESNSLVTLPLQLP